MVLQSVPPMISQAREQYLAGAKAATGTSMCPIGNNAAFCAGGDSNNGVDYGYQDCGMSTISITTRD